MEEIQANLIQSSIKPKNTSNLLATNSMIINKDEDEDENDEEKEEGEKLLHNSNESTKNFHQLYFVKFPALKAKIQRAKELTNKLHKEKSIILDKIGTLNDRILEESKELRWTSVHGIRRDIEQWKREIQIHFPECNDWDPELEPELESINIDNKIQKLCYKFTHGSKNISNERRILKEFTELQTRKEKLYKFDKSTSNNEQVIQLQHLIQEGLNEVKNRQEKERIVKRNKVAITKEITSLEEKLAKINQKRAKVNEFILTAEKQLNDQFDEFMSQWNYRNNLFGANCERSMMLSLEGLKLSHGDRNNET